MGTPDPADVPDPLLVKLTRSRRRPPRRPGRGTSPSTLIHDAASPRPELSAFLYGRESSTEVLLSTPSELTAMDRKSKVLWLNVVGLGGAEIIQAIGDVFGLHRLALEDVIYVHQRSKVEEYDDHLYVVARMLASSVDSGSEQLSLFLGPDFVLTFQEHAGDEFDPVRARLRQEGSRLRERGADYLAYCLLDAVIDGYFPVVDQMARRLDALESEILSGPSAHCLRGLYGIRHDLLLHKRTVLPMREIFHRLVREKSPLISAITRVYLRDCEDHVLQVLDLLDSERDVADELMEAYRSETSRRTNEVMRVLTVIGTIFMPLTFIVGIYGMNFQGHPTSMPELTSPYGYPAVLLVMLVLATSMLLVFRHRGWLGGRARRQ